MLNRNIIILMLLAMLAISMTNHREVCKNIEEANRIASGALNQSYENAKIIRQIEERLEWAYVISN